MSTAYIIHNTRRSFYNDGKIQNYVFYHPNVKQPNSNTKCVTPEGYF